MELKNAGVADVAIRNDSKIFASGGWDGRYKVLQIALHSVML